MHSIHFRFGATLNSSFDLCAGRRDIFDSRFLLRFHLCSRLSGHLRVNVRHVARSRPVTHIHAYNCTKNLLESLDTENWPVNDDESWNCIDACERTVTRQSTTNLSHSFYSLFALMRNRLVTTIFLVCGHFDISQKNVFRSFVSGFPLFPTIEQKHSRFGSFLFSFIHLTAVSFYCFWWLHSALRLPAFIIVKLFMGIFLLVWWLS